VCVYVSVSCSAQSKVCCVYAVFACVCVCVCVCAYVCMWMCVHLFDLHIYVCM